MGRLVRVTGFEDPAHHLATDALECNRERIDDLRSTYFRDYFASWAKFQARFGDGILLWRGHYGDLLARAESQQNPYDIFFRAAQRNLYELPLDWPFSSRWATPSAPARSLLRSTRGAAKARIIGRSPIARDWRRCCRRRGATTRPGRGPMCSAGPPGSSGRCASSAGASTWTNSTDAACWTGDPRQDPCRPGQ